MLCGVDNVARRWDMQAALKQQLGEPLAAPQPVGVDKDGTLITASPAVLDDASIAAALVPMPLTLPAARC